MTTIIKKLDNILASKAAIKEAIIKKDVAQLTTKYVLLTIGTGLYLAKWEEDADLTVTVTNLQQITI